MLLCVDRIERRDSGDVVVLIPADAADGHAVLEMSAGAYRNLVGCDPRESDILCARVSGETVTDAVFDPDETARRKQAARERLDRLFDASKTD